MDKINNLRKVISLSSKNLLRLSFAEAKKFLLLFSDFCNFFFLYLRKKVLSFSSAFENSKNTLVRVFMMKRGRYNRPFLHLTAMGVLAIGVLIAPFIADSFPIFSASASSLAKLASTTDKQSIIVGENVFQTNVSDKPRSEVISYIVEKGDTLSTIAKKFNISVETIKWSNDLTSDDLTIGDELKILPVTGILYKVRKGDTVYSIAKNYATEAQKIVDFPFNEFANPETFSLVEGQMLIVPDGIKPSEQTTFKRDVYVVAGPVAITSAGFTWPLQGIITQFASWYHVALDIAAPLGTPIIAAQDGIVSTVSMGSWDYGFGNNVWIDNGAGLSSHYAHLSGINVSGGQKVYAGKTVLGWIGMTGRTTGPHLHFEIRNGGVLVNPLPYLQ